jgi:hypothetical protein
MTNVGVWLRHAVTEMTRRSHLSANDYMFLSRMFAFLTLVLFIANSIFFLLPLQLLFTAASQFNFTGIVTAKDITAWAGSLFATFIGAYLAFRFGRMQRARERIDANVTAGNVALTTLIEMWDRQTQFQRDVVAPFRDRHDAWFNLTVGTRLDTVEMSLNRNELSFLLESNAQAWQQAIMEDRRFHMMRELIDKRDDVILKEAWPRLAAKGVPIGAQLAEKQFEELLGSAVVQQLRRYTAGITSMIDENVVSSFAAITTLREALLKIYPERKFVNVRPLGVGEPP